MKHIKRIFIGIVVLVLTFVFVFSYKQTTLVNATGETTDANLIVKGAGVRTAGDAGIRFEIDYADYEVPAEKTIKAYGAVIGYGDVKDIGLLTKGGTVNGQSVLNCEITDPDAEGTYFISIFGIPADYYAQDITARAYVVLSDDSLVYGATNQVRNLTQVVVAAHNDPNYVESDNLIKTIYNGIEFKELNDAEIEKINAINPDIIVSKADADKNIVVLKETATATKTLNKTYEYKPYSTLATAIANSFKNYSVYVMDGTYNEAVTINVEGLKLCGPNYGVNGQGTRDTEAIISNNLTIAAANVTLDGLKLTKTSIVNANNVTYNHMNIEAEPDTCCIDNNRKGLIVDGSSSVTTNLVVKNSYLKVLGGNSDHTHDYIAFVRARNLTIENNLIENAPTTLEAGDGIMIYNMYGYLKINNNTFNYATSGYVVRSSYYDTTSFTKLEFNNNVLNGVGSLATAGLYFNYLSANADVEIIGNDFNNVSGTTIRMDYAKTGTCAKIKFNSFDSSTVFKGGSFGKTDFVYGANYLGGGISSDDKFGITNSQKYATEAEMLAAYQASKLNVISNINYELDGGTNDSRNGDSYIESDVTKLYPATSSTKNFVGWTLTASDTNYLTYIPYNQTGEITLYAHWTSIITVELTDNDRRVMTTYNPTLFVKNEFTSGIFNINGTAYSVSDGELFSTIAGAVSKAKSSDVIYVFAGDYSWDSVTISKTINIVGPNAGIKGSETRVSEANVTASSITMNGSITVNGLKFNGGNKTLFQTGTSSTDNVNATLLDISYCYINSYQNVCRYENAKAAKDFKAYMSYNKFSTITQFIIWSRNTSHLTRFDFIGNNITNNAWGATAQNSNIRIDQAKDNCVVNIIGNDFAVEPTLYSATCGFIGINVTNATCVVKYNKFVATAAKLQNYFRPATKYTTITDNVYVVGSEVQTAVPTLTLGTNSTCTGALTVAQRDTAFATYMQTYTK